MANKHTGKNTLLGNREMQIKITVRHHHTQNITAKIKKMTINH